VLTLRQEIEVSQLIGATDAFIRRPFLYAGLIQGLLGGAVAWLVIGASLLSLNAFAADLARLYGVSLQLGFLSLPASLVLLGLSAATGWLAAYLAVNHHLHEARPRPAGTRHPGA
jgi:cell division transport system permease protein